MRSPLRSRISGFVRLGRVDAAAEIRQPGLAHQSQFLGEGVLAEIAGMVVRHRHRVEMALQHRQHVRVRAEGEGLGLGRAASGDHAFEVADAQVVRVQQLAEGRERIDAPGDQLARISATITSPTKTMSTSRAARRARRGEQGASQREDRREPLHGRHHRKPGDRVRRGHSREIEHT